MKLLFTTIAVVFTLVCYGQNPWLVKQINKYGNATSNTNSLEFFNLNGKAIFFANDSTHGYELWQSDGTAPGTSLLKDITPGPQSSNIDFTYPAGNLVYIIKSNISNSGNTSELWRTDGTTAGTYKVMEDGPNFRMPLYGSGGNTSLFNVASIGSNLYIVVGETVGAIGFTNIYKVDGPTGKASLYLSSRGRIGAIGASNNKLYVNANFYYGAAGTVDIGYEVYVFPPNELPAGWPDYNVGRDFSPGTASTLVSEFVNVNDKYMLFYGNVSNAANKGMKLMRLKGDEEIPVVIGDIPNNGAYTDFSSVNRTKAWNDNWSLGDKYFFKNGFVTGGGFYYTVTDGEAAGTFNIQAPNLSLMLGRTTDKIIFGGASYYSKVLLWDGKSPTSFTYLPDAVSSTSLSGNFVWRAVQLGNRIIYFTSAGGADAVFQSGIDGSNCQRLLRLSTGGLGNIVIGNSYFGWGSGDGFFQYSPTNQQLIQITGDYKQWTGAVSTNWADKDNWVPAGAPGTTDDVYISQTTNSPALSASGTCRNLYINTGTLTVNSGVNLAIMGDLTVAGTLTGNGSITRKGTYSNRTFGSGTTSIAQVIINGSDIEYNVENGIYGSLPNMLPVNSVFNFETDHKIILNTTSLSLLKAPFATGVNNKRFFVTNNTGGLNYVTGNSAPGTVTIPISSGNRQYSPPILTGTFNSITVRVVDSVNASGTTGRKLNNSVINKTWLISASTTGPATVKLLWNQQDELPGFDHNNCFVAHYEGGKWVYGKKQTATLNDGLYSIAQDGYTSFSPFTVGSGTNILPVTLINFTGELKHDQAILSWATTAESNSAGFNIERSNDGVHFNNIGFVAAAGNITQAQTYTYTDITTTGNQNFYRLALVDADGKTTYSKIVLLQHTANAGVYCSITKDVLTVRGLTPGQHLQVTNAAGQVVTYVKATGNTQSINLANQAAGMYYIAVMANNGLPGVKMKVIK